MAASSSWRPAARNTGRRISMNIRMGVSPIADPRLPFRETLEIWFMEQTSDNALLNWDVFVTPGIPIVTRDLPPGVREAYFQAMASTLIYGMRDAVLVDAFMTVKQANALADWVAAKGKNLTTIYITHGHGDHWFGIGTLLERFP